MQVIADNPYRVLGVLAGATARDIIRQANTIKKFLAAGQDPPCDYSFLAFSKLNRNLKSVDAAVAKLNFDADKMTAALFWFYKGNIITDEPAFDALKTGDLNTAIQIWEKLLFTEINGRNDKQWEVVSRRNYSAFHNYFVGSFLNNPGAEKAVNAIAAQLRFLESNFYASFVIQVADITFKTTKEELQLIFLNEIIREIEQKTINVTFVQLASILNNNNPVKQVFIKNISQKLTEKIAGQIQIARNKADDKPNAAKRGEDLFKQTKEEIQQLKIILGERDFTYFNSADKLANEILQCGIDHFEYFKNTDADSCEHSLKLLDWANSLAVGVLIKQNCRENTMIIQEWMKKKKKNIFQHYLQKFSNINNFL